MLLIVSFVSALLLSFLMLWIFLRPPATPKVVQERLKAIDSVRRSPESDFEPIELSRQVKSGFTYRLGEHLQNYHFAADLQKLMLHAGSKSTLGSFAAWSAALAAIMALIAHTFVGPLPVVLAATVVGGIARYASLRFLKSRRMKAFNTALPDAIELMARALRAGHSMSSSIEIIAQQSVEPLASEFEAVYQQQKFGIPFRDALRKKLPAEDKR